MIHVGIDIGKLKHCFCIIDYSTGEELVTPTFFENNQSGFRVLSRAFADFPKDSLLIGMEDTGHYHFALLRSLIAQGFNVALMNPTTTDFERKRQGSATKNDKLDTITICDVLACAPHKKKLYRLVTPANFSMYEMKQLTRQHHNLKEQLNTYSNRLQRSIDLTFPEFNSLFKSKYGEVFMNILKNYGSAEKIAQADIRSLRKCFSIKGKGKRIALTAEQLKETAKVSVGYGSLAEEMNIRHLVDQIELLHAQIAEIDKKIEEFSLESNSPILTIPGISHFSGTSILAELGDIRNYDKVSKVIKMAGVAPREYESSQFRAEHTAITKKGSKYLRKTLYQIIVPVIRFNPVFKAFYDLKISQGKGHRCAQGHCVRKLLRIIYHLLTTGQQFDPVLLK